MSERLLAGSILDEQLATEKQAVEDGVMRYRRMVDDMQRRGEAGSGKRAEQIMAAWLPALTAAIREEQQTLKRDKRRADGGGAGEAWAMKGFELYDQNPERLAYIGLRETINLCMDEPTPSGPKLIVVAGAIGRAACACLDDADLRKIYRKQHQQLKQMRRMNVKKHRALSRKIITHREEVERRVQIQIGSRILWLMISVLSAAYDGEPFERAFKISYYIERKRKIRYVEMNPNVFDAINSGHALREVMRPVYRPMLVPPYKWMDGTQGGYASIRTSLISNPRRDQKAAIARADMSEVYTGIDALARTGWRVDPELVRIAEVLARRGKGEAGTPIEGAMEYPDKVEGDKDSPEIKAWKRERRRIHEINKERRAKRVKVASTLAIANEHLDREFYLPHRLCFRGRSYPIPQHINHHGEDISRGLLHFANAEPADAAAMIWIRIHAANSWANKGLDKASFADRVAWTNDNAKMIERTAKDPLDDGWWMQAECPFQFLAACRAICIPERAAHVPVYLDGSCNGLQHYAAMTRDEVTGAAVNLTCGERPQDVYGGVAAELLNLVRADAATKADAKMALPYVERSGRSICKQPVMTSFYDVTTIGMRGQIRGVLGELGMLEADAKKVSGYLADRVRKAMSDRCKLPFLAMEYLRNLAKEVVGKHGIGLSWTNPVGLPVVQPYKRDKVIRVATVFRGMKMAIETPDAPSDTRRQVRSFAPNYLHSVDGAHMMKWATEATGRGITVAGVHDAFATHAKHARESGRILREQFIAIHKGNVLQTLANQLRAICPDADIPDPPAQGLLNLSDILASPYAFA